MADYQNPQQEPGSERRLLVVILITFVVLILSQTVLKKYMPPPAAQPENHPAQTQPTPAAPSAAPAAKAAPVPSTTITKQASTESETVIENDLYKITFTNRGAQVKSWILKKFDNDAQNGPLDLVHSAASQKFGYPLSLWTYDETLRNRLNSVLYIASNEGNLTAPATITFEYADQDLVIRKTFRFDHTYVLNVETSVVYKGAEIFAAPAWPAGFGDELTPASYAASGIDYHNDASTERSGYIFFPTYVTRLTVKAISGGNTIRGPFEWAGTGDQYFTAIFIPNDPVSAAMVTLHNAMEIAQKPGLNPIGAGSKDTANIDLLGAAVGNLRGPTTERMYVGPKELAVLDAVPVPTIKNDNPESARHRQLWAAGHPRASALSLAEVDLQPHCPQLGMGHRHSNVHHHHPAAAPAHHADEVDAEDAAHPAPDQEHPGEIQEVQPPRSAQGGNERGNQRSI